MRHKNPRFWILAALLVPALACVTVMGGLSGQPTSTPEVSFEVTEEILPDLPTDLPSLETAQPTLEAIATEFFSGEAPDDIPIMDSNRNLFESSTVVSYSTAESFDTTVGYYKEQMPANGWVDDGNSFEFEGSAVQNYTKDGRLAAVTITSSNDETSVGILITEQ